VSVVHSQNNRIILVAKWALGEQSSGCSMGDLFRQRRHSPLATFHMNEVLLTHIAAMQVLLLTQPKTFPGSAYVNGLSDNEAICTLLQRRLIASKRA